jgi:outer membrane protein TolC
MIFILKLQSTLNPVAGLQSMQSARNTSMKNTTKPGLTSSPMPKTTLLFSLKELKLFRAFFLAFLFLSLPLCGFAQQSSDTANSLTLEQCIDFAIQHQPSIKQAEINISIAKATNAVNLSGWLPQVNATGSINHYLEQPTTFFTNTGAGGVPIPQKSGVINTAIPVLGVTQTLFNPSLLYAAKSAPYYEKLAVQANDSSKINVVANVSKTYYSLLVTLLQIDVLKEDTTRLTKNYNDAYHQYVGGIVDETDYEQASITLNNSKAQLQQAIQSIPSQYAILKQAMGYQPEAQFNIVFDTASMQQDVTFDTTQVLQYQNRVEFQALQTSKGLQHQLTNYYRTSFIPTVSAYYNYDYEFQNNTFSDLFNHSYPYSSIGIQFSMPIFTGFARLKNLHKAKLQEDYLNWGEVNLKSQIYTEYKTALANYKSDLYNMNTMKENTALAKRVYRVVMLQYNQGIIPYLNVLTAESNLITSQIGYLNALSLLLSSKIDLQKSMGFISSNR